MFGVLSHCRIEEGVGGGVLNGVVNGVLVMPGALLVVIYV